MSISPTHWMPIHGGQYPDLHSGADEDASSLPLSPLDLHTSASSSSHYRHSHHHHHHRRSQQPRRRSRSSERTSAHRHHHEGHPHNTHAAWHYHAPSHGVHKVSPPAVPSPHSLLQGYPSHGRPHAPGGSGGTPTLPRQWGSAAINADSISPSRSNSVASCLSSSESGSDTSSFAHTFTPTQGDTPFVCPQSVVPVVRTDRTSSAVLAEMAMNGHRSAPPQPGPDHHRIIDAENGNSASQNTLMREGEEEEEHGSAVSDNESGDFRKPAVSITSAFPHPPPPPPPPPLPPVPPTLPRPSAYASGESEKAIYVAVRPASNINSTSSDAPPARKPQPRVTSTVPAPCQSLFQHMEGSPHGIQMLAAQSPRLARRKESQTLDSDKVAAATATGASTVAAGTEAGKTAEASASAVLSPGGSSNGLSARTSGLPTASTPTLFRSAAAPSFPAAEAAEATFFTVAPGPPSNSAEKTTSPVSSFSTTAAPGKNAGTNMTASPYPPPPLPAARGGGATSPAFAVSPRHPSQLLSPTLPLARREPPMSMATPESCRDALSIPTTPTAHMTRPPPHSLPHRFSIPVEDSGSSSSTTALPSGGALKCRPPRLNLTSPRLSSAGQLSSSYVSPLTDYPPEGHSALLPSLPTSPLPPPRASSTTPLVPPLDFSSFSDGPLVRDGAVSAGPWWRSTDEASGLQSPCVVAQSYPCSGYDEDDDESEDEFADYRPRWRKEEERRQLVQQQQQAQETEEKSTLSRGKAGSQRTKNGEGADVGAEAEVSSNEDYIVPGYHDRDAVGAAGWSVRNADGRRGSKVSRRAFPSRAAAAYANRSLRENLSRPFWRSGGGGSKSGWRVGSSATGWTASVMRFLSVAGTWATRLLAIYISSLLILKTRSKM